MQDTVWTVLLILCLIIFFGLYDWAREEHRRKLKLKMAQKPADGTDWLWYTDKGTLDKRIERESEELRQITEGRERG